MKEKKSNVKNVVFIIIGIMIFGIFMVFVLGTVTSYKASKKIIDNSKKVYYVSQARQCIDDVKVNIAADEFVPVSNTITKSYYVLIDTDANSKEAPVLRDSPSVSNLKGYVFIDRSTKTPTYYVCVQSDKENAKYFISDYDNELDKTDVKEKGTCDIKKFSDKKPVQLVGRE